MKIRLKKLSYSISFLVVAGLLLLLNSCGTNTSAPEAIPAAANAVIDTKAPSDSKGIGKFTDVKLDAIDPAKVEHGKAAFTAKCTACHKLTADKFVGPGLLGVTKRRTPEWALNMMTNPAEMIKTDPVAKKLFEEMLVPMTFQNITDNDARNIFEYLRQNDSK